MYVCYNDRIDVFSLRPLCDAVAVSINSHGLDILMESSQTKAKKKFA